MNNFGILHEWSSSKGKINGDMKSELPYLVLRFKKSTLIAKVAYTISGNSARLMQNQRIILGISHHFPFTGQEYQLLLLLQDIFAIGENKTRTSNVRTASQR